MIATTVGLAGLIKRHDKQILADWMKEQLSASTLRGDLLNEHDLREQSQRFLSAFQQAWEDDGSGDIAGESWAGVRGMLAELSNSRALAGFSPSETATFVFSLKQPLFTRLNAEFKNDAAALGKELWSTSMLLDKLGLHTTELYTKSRESVIERQQRELLELSTPVVELWQDILALPLVGSLDSQRTQIVMETLLQKIVETGASIAIIDITGVPTVDTLVAQHLLKTVAATRLMGADCIISGIRPQIAQTIVHLGIDLHGVASKGTLADALQLALDQLGYTVTRRAA